MTEKHFEKKLRETIKKRQGVALKFWCVSLTGFPDRIVLMPVGRIWFVELKSPGKKPSPKQQIIHRFLNGLGFPVTIIDSEESLNEFLELTK